MFNTSLLLLLLFLTHKILLFNSIHFLLTSNVIYLPQFISALRKTIILSTENLTTLNSFKVSQSRKKKQFSVSLAKRCNNPEKEVKLARVGKIRILYLGD